MRYLAFNVDNQVITKDENCDFSNIIKGSHNYLACKFNFSEEWDGYDKIIEFVTKSGSKFFSLKDTEAVIVPDEATNEWYFKIKLYAVRNNEVIFPTNTVLVKQKG